MSIITGRRQLTRRNDPGVLRAVRAQVARASGVQVDTNLLDLAEQAELTKLTHKLAGSGLPAESRGGFNFGRLTDKERRTWEKLVERAADKPDYFNKRREEKEIKDRMAELAAKARRPPARPRLEERGAVALPRQVAFEFLRDGILLLEHFALLVCVLGQLENGEALSPRSRFEGETLVLDRACGIGAQFDPEGRITPRWLPILDHLRVNGLLTTEVSGTEVRVTLGPRLVAASRMRAA